MTENELMNSADQLAANYIASVKTRRVFPDDTAISGLARFDEALPTQTSDPAETLNMLDEFGTPATVTSNGGRYFGFVIGATLPAAAAAERLAAAWDQCGSSFVNSPVAAKIEDVATKWVLDILDLPRESRIGFGTSATACGLSMLAVARRTC